MTRMHLIIISVASLIHIATASAEPSVLNHRTAKNPVHLQIVERGQNPYPTKPRTDLSVNVGGGKGVVIAPHWVMTASHCISSRRKGRVPVTYIDSNGDKQRIISDKVIRSPSVDIALVRLTKPAKGRTPLLLLKDGFPYRKHTKYYHLKKVAGNAAWPDIPARVTKHGGGKRLYVSKSQRKGKAGTSGSPWVMHSQIFGDVLVGITHGSGRVPQVGKISGWIQRVVTTHSDDSILWLTPAQLLKKVKTPSAPHKTRETPPGSPPSSRN